MERIYQEKQIARTEALLARIDLPGRSQAVNVTEGTLAALSDAKPRRTRGDGG